MIFCEVQLFGENSLHSARVWFHELLMVITVKYPKAATFGKSHKAKQFNHQSFLIYFAHYCVHPSTTTSFRSLYILAFIHQFTSPYLVSHDHGRPSMNAQDWYERLRGNKIQNLGDGLLVSAVPEHHAVDLGSWHQVTHVGDDAFWISLIDQQCDHVDIDGVFFAPQRSDIPVWDVARASQDHCNVQDRHFFWATSSLLLSRHGIGFHGQRHQESQGEQRAITSAVTAAIAAPSTPPLTSFAAEGHTAKPLHPLHERKLRGERDGWRQIKAWMRLERERGVERWGREKAQISC